MRKKSPSPLLTPFALAGLLYLGTVTGAAGCGFHTMPEIQFDSMHAGSLSVAVALRKAADNGTIDAQALEAQHNHTALYGDAVRDLQTFRHSLDVSPAAAALPASFTLGFVESRLWSRYTRSDGKVDVDIHTDGPAGQEAVVLTAEPVLTAIMNGTLSAEDAFADGLIAIEGNDREKAAIRRVLLTLPVSSSLSSR